MSERKVLNKYYPPDFDPSKIPRLRLPRDRQYTVRLMAPCNMRCKTCGEYIYKGKKFNARKETVQNEEYLGIKVFRFYIKCPRCLAEITFKTDPENADYIVEHGASRNFQALKLAEEAAAKEARELEEEEKNNPMKLLENRTKASKQEMELMETLAELKDLNQRHAKVDLENLLQQKQQQLMSEIKRQEDEDEALVRSIFGKAGDQTVKRIIEEPEPTFKEKKLADTEPERPIKKQKLVSSSLGILHKKSTTPLVRLKNDCSEKSAAEVQVDVLKSTQVASKLVNSSTGISSKKSTTPLVKIKNDSSKAQTMEPQVNKPQSAICAATQGTSLPSALSLLGSYSDSDSS